MVPSTVCRKVRMPSKAYWKVQVQEDAEMFTCAFATVVAPEVLALTGAPGCLRLLELLFAARQSIDLAP